jgi:hypothetical protein
LLVLTVHVLTLKQPWAWAVFHAGKDVENRSYPVAYRGPLYIHAGKAYDPEGAKAVQPFITDPPLSLDFGLIIGHVQLVGCVRDHPSRWASPGSWHWLIAEPVLLPEPVPHRGLPWIHRREEL